MKYKLITVLYLCVCASLVVRSDEEEEEVPTQPFNKKKQPPQPINPTTALAQHYQLLQQEMVKQKLETSGKRVKHMIFKGTWRVCDEDLMNKHVGYDGTIFLS